MRQSPTATSEPSPSLVARAMTDYLVAPFLASHVADDIPDGFFASPPPHLRLTAEQSYACLLDAAARIGDYAGKGDMAGAEACAALVRGLGGCLSDIYGPLVDP